MSPTPRDEHSSPIKRAFSKFLERGDVSQDAGRRQETANPAAPRTAATPSARPAGAANRGPTAARGASAPATTQASGQATGAGPRAGNAPGLRPQATEAKRSTTPTAAGPAPAASPRTYTVQKGDSLSKIAQQVYGRADAWPRIFDANRDRIHDPDLIHPGQELVLPDAPKLH